MEKIGRKAKDTALAKKDSTVGTSKDAIPKPTKNKFMFVPLYVVQNLLQQASKKSTHTSLENEKNVKAAKKSGDTKTKSNQPAIYITEKNGKRFLVVNPNSNSELIKGFANVDSHFVSFAIPENGRNGHPVSHINGLPAVNLPGNSAMHPGPFGKSAAFDYQFPGDDSLYNNNQGAFQGYMAVPIVNGMNPNGFMGFNAGYFNNGFNGIFSGGYNNGFSAGFNGGLNGFNQGFGGYNNGFNSFNNGYNNGYNNRFNSQFPPPYVPQQNMFPMQYPNQGVVDPFYQQRRGFNGNAFMYGPAFYGNPYAHRNMFESISMTQTGVPGHFYRDPSYNPRESEAMFQSEGPHTTRDEFEQRPSDLNQAETNEVDNEIRFSEETHRAGEKQEEQTTQSEPTEEAKSTPSDENSSQQEGIQEDPEPNYETQENGPQGYSPSPVEIQDPNKRSNSPFVFTKDHVGFGPITVEAKTANAPLDDPDDI